MRPVFDYGDEVRVIRNVRNDGTFPGRETGELLIRRGSSGYVRNVGSYLQDQVIYSVHFMESNLLVGCREEELIPASEAWTPNLFEFRDKVRTIKDLVMRGKVEVECGEAGEILKVVRDAEQGVAYHVRINGRTFLVPETALTNSISDDNDTGVPDYHDAAS